jgi:hypothetical protein
LISSQRSLAGLRHHAIKTKKGHSMTKIELILPDFWAAALFNDDTSGFEYDDEMAFHAFCDWAVKKYGTSEPVHMTDDSDFMTYHDAKQFGVLACNASTYTFLADRGNPKTSANVTLAHTMQN